MKRKIGSSEIIIFIGALFLLYAYIGNYTTLPGYIRFLERGRTSVSESTSDISVIIGAIKTIIWLFSFQIGIFLTLLGALLSIGINRSFIIYYITGSIIWLGFAGIPKISGPFSLFYAIGGLIVLLLIIFLIVFWTKNNKTTAFSNYTYFKIIGYMFFALASWDVCGLGTMGRILHLEAAYKLGTEPMLITQMTKMMFEFILAWGFTVLGYFVEFKNKK